MEPFKSRAKLVAPDLTTLSDTSGLPHPWDSVSVIKMGTDPDGETNSTTTQEPDANGNQTPSHDPETGEIHDNGPPDRHPDDPGPLPLNIVVGNDNHSLKSATKPQSAAGTPQQYALDFASSLNPNSISNRATPRTPPPNWGNRKIEADYLEQLAKTHGSYKGGHDVDPFA